MGDTRNSRDLVTLWPGLAYGLHMKRGGPSVATRHSTYRALPWLILSAWAVAVLAVTAAAFARYLDTVDESYGLLLTRYPDASKPAGDVFLFQFLLHPIFEWTGEDLVAYRWAGLAVVLGSVTSMVAASWLFARRSLPATNRYVVATALLVVLASSTAIYALQGRSPGYRSVAFVGLSLVAVGVAITLDRRPVLGGVIAGAASVVAMTGKPTSAAAGACVAAAAVAVAGAPFFRFAGSASLGAFLMTAVVCLSASMSPVALIEYLTRGYRQVTAGQAYVSGLDMFGVAPAPTTALMVFGPVVLLPFAIAALSAWWGRTSGPHYTGLLLLLGGVAAALVSAGAVLSLSQRSLGAQILPLAGIELVLVAVLTTAAFAARPARAQTERALWALVGMLVLLPLAAALGTNTRFAYITGQASAFWALALVLAVALTVTHLDGPPPLLFPALVVVLTVTTATQAVSLTNDGPADSVLGAVVPSGVLGGSLGLGPDDAVVFSSLEQIREEYRLEGVPSVDLTGFATGYQLQLGTRPLGRASFFGALKGSDRSAATALAHESCSDRAEAWLLYAPDNPMDVSTAFTARTLDLDRDYQVVSWFHPTQGPPEWRSLTIRLLRPRTTVYQALGCAGNP